MPEITSFHLFAHNFSEDQMQLMHRTLDRFHQVQHSIKIKYQGSIHLPINNNLVSWYQVLEMPYSDTPEIYLTSHSLSDNWYSHSGSNKSLINIKDWEQSFKDWTGEKPVYGQEAYLIHKLILAIIINSFGVDELHFLHQKTVGCISDLCEKKSDAALKMRSGYICQTCIDKASEAGISSAYLDYIQLLLDESRLLSVGRSPQNIVPKIHTQNEIDIFIKNQEGADYEFPQPLIDAIKTKQLSLVIGSGLSIQNDNQVEYRAELPWERLPSWTEILDRMINRYKAFYPKNKLSTNSYQTLNEYLSNLELFREYLNPNRYYSRTIFDIFLPKIIKVGLANQLIFKLPIRCCFTTNYDFLINFSAPAGTPTYTWKESVQALEYLKRSNGMPPIIKLHGCASRVDTIILTSSEYSRLNASSEYKELTNNLLRDSSVLFVGCGLNDPLDLDMAIKSANLVGDAQGDKYAILPAGISAQAKQLHPNIEQILIKDYNEIPSILASLILKSR